MYKECKKWKGFEDIEKIKNSIKDNTRQVIIRGTVYNVENAPKSYINHFAVYKSGKVLRRWIDKLFYHNYRYTQKGEELKEKKKIRYWENPQKELDKNNKWRKSPKGIKYFNKLSEEKKAITSQKKKDFLAYKNSTKGIADALEKKKIITEKKRIADLERYHKNPIPFNLKRLLLHCVTNNINGKSWNNSNEIINYKKCINKLKDLAKINKMTIKEIKKKGYHIDHIIPVASYDTNDPKELKKCFSYHNLQWLPPRENIQKSDKIIKSLIKPLPTKIYPKSWNNKIIGE
jgi:hypothetical protein